MIGRVFLAAALLFVAANDAQAAEPCQPSAKDPIDVWMDAAIAKDSSTAGMRGATNAAREMWDKEMNVSYARLMKRLSPAQRQALRVSQRNWLAFRDSEGAVISKVVAAQDGTMFQLMATSDALDLVRARTLELRAYEAAINGP